MATVNKTLKQGADTIHYQTNDSQVILANGKTLREMLNGAIIPGNISIQGKITSSEKVIAPQFKRVISTPTVENGYACGFGVENADGTDYVSIGIGVNGGVKCMYPSTPVRKTMDLGAPGDPWRDMWVGDYIRGANGLTPLPNGLYLQWGYVNLSVSTQHVSAYVDVTLPKPYVGELLTSWGSCSTNATWGNDNSIGLINVSVYQLSKDKIRVYATPIGPLAQAFSMTIRWFTLGF